MEIGSRIMQLRKQKKVTQQQLAEYLSVLPQTVSRWEAGGGTPDISLLPKIAIFFGVTLDELFGMRDLEQVLQLVTRYSVLRDDKSYEDAMRAVIFEEEQAKAEGDDDKRKQLTAYRMHLLLQKSRQSLKEADEVCNELLSETEDENDPLHLAIRLQKLQFDIEDGNVAKCIKEVKRNFFENPDIETFQLYGWAMIETGQGEAVLELREHGFVKEELKKEDANAVTVWMILFEAATIEENLSFFEENYEHCKELLYRLNKIGSVLHLKILLASLYAAQGMDKEKEVLKSEMLIDLENDEEIKRQELLYERQKEKIRTI